MEGPSYEDLGYEPATPYNDLGYESPTSVQQFPTTTNHDGRAKRRNTISQSRDVPNRRGIQRTSEVYHQGSQHIVRPHLRRRASLFAFSDAATASHEDKKLNNDLKSTMLRRNSMTRIVPTSRGVPRTSSMYKQGSQELSSKRTRRASIEAFTSNAKPLPSCMKKECRTIRRDVAPTIPSRKASIGHTNNENSAIETIRLTTVSGKFEVKASGMFLVYNPQTHQRGISPLSFYNLLKYASSNILNGEVKINNKTIVVSKADTREFIPMVRPAAIPNKVVSWAA